MCEFISGLYCKNGDMICDPRMSDSHEDLLKRSGLDASDKKQFRESDFVRWECVPHRDPQGTSTEWTFRVDEKSVPGWVEPQSLEARVKEYIAAHILKSAGVVTAEHWYIDTPDLHGDCSLLAQSAR